MADEHDRLIIRPDNAVFADQIDKMFEVIAKRLAAGSREQKFFRKLCIAWKNGENAKPAKDWIDELDLRIYSSATQEIAKSAKVIRTVLAEVCLGKSVSIEFPERSYVLEVVCRTAHERREWKSPQHIIGVLAADLHDWIVNPILAGAQKILREQGYELLVRGSGDNTYTEAMYLEELSETTEGIIAIPVWDGDPEGAYRRMAVSGVPLVLVDRSIERLDQQLPSVTSDNFEGGYKAVQYLLEKYQCKRLQIISDYPLSSSRLRIDGAMNATSGNEIPVLPASQRQGRAAALKWAFDQTTKLISERNLVDGVGIFALNDHLAAGCRSALERAGVVAPVIGFDGQHWGAYLSPPLETIYQDMDRMACQAALRLLRRMAGSHETGPLLIDVQLKTSADRMIEKAP